MLDEKIKQEELIEEWREYNRYQVSNYGKVINKHGKLLTLNADKYGYINTSITGLDGKRIGGLHRIIATVFIPNPNNLPEVNHIDGIKANNRVDNLEWCTKKYNQEHEVRVLQKRNGEKNCRSAITNEQAIEVYNLCKEGEMLYKDIAKMYGIFPQEVTRIALGTNWTCLGLPPLPKLVRGSRGKGRYKKLNKNT